MAYEWITVGSGRVRGLPCIRDTRVMVCAGLGLLAAGQTVEQVFEAYPYRLGIEGRGGNHAQPHMLADGRLLQLFDAFDPADLFEGTELEAPSWPQGHLRRAHTPWVHSGSGTRRGRSTSPHIGKDKVAALGTGGVGPDGLPHDLRRLGRALEVFELIASADANVLTYDLPLPCPSLLRAEVPVFSGVGEPAAG